MGLSQSKPATASPSAAFGRIRISSPHVAQPHHSARLAQRASASSLERIAALSEKSPLISGRSLQALESNDESINAMGSPPLLLWIGPALFCALMYALYNIFIKKGSASIHPVLGGVILQFIAAILGCLLLSILVVKDGWEEMNYDSSGVFWAIWAGVAVGAAEILSFVVSGMGVQSMQSIPIIIGGSVLFGTVLGFTILHEVLTYRGWFGVSLIAVGIGLVGTDPGGAGGIHG
eukprot:CAMPEP_0172451726 /NCGR_PEP_ID=MMETSP1065-20121228/9643_1 /TAXON_ID=265537 /ORGANISM="Amphiprora paludosa, Strain CCMP125" /LENGTH=233 /DNA_ID=CAMNT_0013203695 /DNA_START=140 /DNA_END=841 /DNA_ORIENTATION=-